MSEERDVGGLAVDDVELDELDDEQPEAGDEQEPEAGDDEPGESDEEPAERPQERKRGARERRAAELRELRETVSNTRRELESLRSQQQQPQPRPDNSAELARIAAYERDQLPLLPADQIIGYWRQKDRQEIGGYLQQQQAAIADQLDRSAWQASLAGNPRRARFAAQVEQTIAGMAPGPARQREVVYKYLLGEEIERQAGRRAPGQRAAAQRRVQSQRTQPGGGRSDVARDRQPSGGGDDMESVYARVRGRAIWS